jgi:hypothetical protein
MDTIREDTLKGNDALSDGSSLIKSALTCHVCISTPSLLSFEFDNLLKRSNDI